MSRARNWIATYNNPPELAMEALEMIHKEGKAVYTVG